MITKTFLKSHSDHLLAVEDMVTEKLRQPYYFLIANGVAYLKAQGRTLDMCQVPLNLHRAIRDGTTTSFSVTLPARYWK